MNPDDVIKKVEDNVSEWSEMSANPGYFIARVLATKIIKLEQHIEYLEKRLKHDSSTSKKYGIHSSNS